MWHMVGDGECLEDFEQKDDVINKWMNEFIMKVFIEQPRLHRIY